MARDRETLNSARRIAAAERRRKALEMRKAGASYEMIAVACGFKHRRRAHQCVTAAVRALTQDLSKEVRVLELERLDRLMYGLWERARDGELGAIDRVLKIMERRDALCGIAMPAGGDHIPYANGVELDPIVARRLMIAAAPDQLPEFDIAIPPDPMDPSD
jgi:hypothetical protein